MSNPALDVRSVSKHDDKVVPHWKFLIMKARKALADGREVRFDPAFARPMPGQPREHFDQAGLERLAESMLEVGQIYPGIVRRVHNAPPPILFELIDGERRQRSALMVKMEFRATEIECDDETARFIIAAVANFNRASHTPLEISNTINKMYEIGAPIEEISKLLGISAYWAYQLHGLQKLHPKIRKMMDPTLPERKRLNVSAAIQIAKVDRSLQIDLAERVVSRLISQQDLRRVAIKVSEKAGTYIRKRQVGPSRQFQSISSLAGMVKRSSSDLEGRLKEFISQEALLSRSHDERRTVLKNLLEADEVITRCIGMVRDVKQTNWGLFKK